MHSTQRVGVPHPGRPDRNGWSRASSDQAQPAGYRAARRQPTLNGSAVGTLWRHPMHTANASNNRVARVRPRIGTSAVVPRQNDHPLAGGGPAARTRYKPSGLDSRRLEILNRFDCTSIRPRRQRRGVRCPGHTIQFMAFGYDEYVRRVRELASWDARQDWEHYESWTPYRLQDAA